MIEAIKDFTITVEGKPQNLNTGQVMAVDDEVAAVLIGRGLAREITPPNAMTKEALTIIEEVFPDSYLVELVPAEVRGYACTTCRWRLYKASGVLRCHFKRVVRCSHYIGPKKEHHFTLCGGPAWKDSLRRG